MFDTKKMIPVPTNAYTKIVFKKLEDTRYKDLFEKEYAFCLKIQEKILMRVEKNYKCQKETKTVKKAYCNYDLCEKQLKEWIA